MCFSHRFNNKFIFIFSAEKFFSAIIFIAAINFVTTASAILPSLIAAWTINTFKINVGLSEATHMAHVCWLSSLSIVSYENSTDRS